MVETALRDRRASRERRWTESIAVGSPAFVEQVQRDLGVTAHYRTVEDDGDSFVLRETTEIYRPVLAAKPYL